MARKFDVGLEPFAVAITSDGIRAYVTNENTNFVYVVDLATDTIITAIDVEDTQRDFTFTPNGAYLYVARNDKIVIIETPKNIVVADIAFEEGGYEEIIFTPDGTYAYVADETDIVLIDNVKK